MAISLKVFKKELRKKRYKKSLSVVPYAFTFANATFGFLSMVHALEGNITLSALFILCAAFMDSIDGRLARYFRVTSSLGMELDSLCDAVSFCLAPMLLLYSSYEEASSFFIVALVMALCAGLFRLARFNTISTKNKDDFFKGLPTTISAMFIASLVYYRATLSSGIFAPLLEEQWLGMTVLLLAFLMISPIHFPSFKKRSLHAVIFRFLLFLTGALVLLSLFCNIPVFFIATFTYILSGPVVGLLNYAKRLRA